MCGRDDPADADQLRKTIREKLLRAIPLAIDMLDREARGERIFREDLHLRACTTLARLGPSLLRLAEGSQRQNLPPLFHPSLPPDLANRLYAEMRAEMLAAEDRDRLRADGSPHDPSDDDYDDDFDDDD